MLATARARIGVMIMSCACGAQRYRPGAGVLVRDRSGGTDRDHARSFSPSRDLMKNTLYGARLAKLTDRHQQYYDISRIASASHADLCRARALANAPSLSLSCEERIAGGTYLSWLRAGCFSLRQNASEPRQERPFLSGRKTATLHARFALRALV